MDNEKKTVNDQLAIYIQMAVADGEVSLEEYNRILKLAEQVGLTVTDVDLMVQQEFRKQFKATIENFTKDGRINSTEMESLKQRAAKIGISEDDLQLLLTEALNNQDEVTRKKVKTIFASVSAVAATIATGLGALYMLTDSKSSDSRKYRKFYKEATAPRLERCKTCRRFIMKGRPVYRYQLDDFCSINCVKAAVK